MLDNNKNFNHIKVHTQYSICEGAIKIEKLADYCKATGIILKYIQPGKPTQNAYIERFNRSYREDVLDAYLFEEIEQLRNLSWKWLLDYNQNHPHQSLKNMSPLNFIKQNQHI